MSLIFSVFVATIFASLLFSKVLVSEVIVVVSGFKMLGSVICLLISAKSAYLQDIEINLSDLL